MYPKHLNALALLLGLVRSNEILDILVGRKTRIRPAYYAYLALSHDPKTNSFIGSRETNSLSASIRVNRDGHHYIFGTEDDWMCIIDGELKVCKDPTPFDLETTAIGFKIKSDEKCLTFGRRVSLEGCQRKSDKQDFILEIDRKLICGGIMIETKYIKNLIANQPMVDIKNKRMAETIVKLREKKMRAALGKMKHTSRKMKRFIWRFWKFRWPKWYC